MTGAGRPRTEPPDDAFTSYSRNFADVILHRLFRGRPHGFFVDVGPGQPQRGNDLYALYRAGWSGINVEPDPAAAERLRQLRPRDHTVEATLSGSESGSDPGGEPGGGHTTLAALLAEWAVRTVDVLRVDAGPDTEHVLGGNDWERFRPRVLLLVARRTADGPALPPGLRDVLEQRGYRHALFDGMNEFYLEHGFEAPAGLALPPNPFDRFVLDETEELRRRVAQLETDAVAGAGREAGLDRALQAALAAHQGALDAVARLGEENRRLAGQGRQLDADNRRLRSSTDRMQAELGVLNRLLEPLHGLSEQMDRQRRSHEVDRDRLLAELDRQERRAEEESRRRDADLRAALQRRDREQQVALQQRDLQDEAARARSALDRQDELHRRDAEARTEADALRAALAAVYGSSSWRLTRAWRGFGRLSRRLVR